ncbi:MAG: 5'-nucleotidase C-terminal domain-containing protein [Stomatobaculum sp.]|nr:5'-nucleotidase C-terminal domain-containing protein [Stomatobaculum sp.]
MALFLCCFAGTSFAESSYSQDIRPVPAEDLSGKVVILHSNDVHGAIDGYAKMTALREAYEKLGAEVILADAGDFMQGDAYVNLSSGADAITMMNAAGYTVATLGNHEFDYGYEQLMKNLQKAEFPVICANIFENGATILEPVYLYTAGNGRKIGFIGLDTEEAKTKANPNLTIGITFYGGSDMYRIAEEQAQALRQEGADLVIALTHLGVSAESAPGGNRSLDLRKNTNGIDFILDGHSHTVMTGGNSAETIQSTGTKFKYVGVLVVGADGKLEDHYLVDAGQIEAEEASAAAAAAKEIEARVDAEYKVKIAVNDVTFEAEHAVNRSRETNSGNLITDAMLWYFRKDLSVLKVPEDHLVAVINGGSIRAGIPLGDVTKKDINTVYPFGNTLSVSYVTGEELLEALEASSFCTPESIGGYPQTGGISMTLDTTKEYDQGKQYPGSTYYAPKSIRRVTIHSINGQPFCPEDTYAMACTNFMAAGGDTYFVLSMNEGFDTGVSMDDLLIMYIKEGLNGVLSSSKYANVRGDQKTILAGEAAAESAAPAQNAAPAAAETASGAAASAGSVYTVEAGDSLWKIAQKIYGDGSKWNRIYQNNRDVIRRPDLIMPGQLLKLPDAA